MPVSNDSNDISVQRCIRNRTQPFTKVKNYFVDHFSLFSSLNLIKSYPSQIEKLSLGPHNWNKTLQPWNPLTQFKMHMSKVCRHMTMFTTTLEFSSWKSNACMVITSNLVRSLYKAAAPYLTRERERAMQGFALHWLSALEGPWCRSAWALFRRRLHRTGRQTHSRGSLPSLFFELDLDLD